MVRLATADIRRISNNVVAVVIIMGLSILPALYAWLLENWEKEPEKAEYLQDILTPCSFIELKNYPLSAKTYLAKEIGFSIKARTRKNTADYISETELSELRQIKELSDRAMEFISK